MPLNFPREIRSDTQNLAGAIMSNFRAIRSWSKRIEGVTGLGWLRADGTVPVNPVLEGNDGNMASEVEFFPKGTLIDMGRAHSKNMGTSLTTSFASLGSFEVACDYNNQPVYAELTAYVRLQYLAGGAWVQAVPYVNDDVDDLNLDMFVVEAPAAAVTDPGHDHNIPVDGANHTHSLAGHTHGSGSYYADTLAWHGSYASVYGTSGGSAASSGTGSAGHDHGDADSNTTGITVATDTDNLMLPVGTIIETTAGAGSATAGKVKFEIKARSDAAGSAYAEDIVWLWKVWRR